MKNNFKIFFVLLVFQSCGYPLSNAYKLLQEKKYTEAKDAFTGKINSNELKKVNWKYDAFLGRGICKNLLNDNPGAVADYDSCIKIKSQTDYAYCNKSISLAEMCKPDDALDEINQALQIYSLNSLSCYQRARMYVYFKNYQGALEDLLISIKLWNAASTSCNRSCPLNLRAMIYQKMGEPDKALPDYIRAGTKAKDYVLMNYNQALCYLQKNDTANARLALDRAKKLDKSNSIQGSFVDLQFQKLNNAPVAVTEIEEKINSSSLAAEKKYYLLACANSIAGRHDKAVENLSECMKASRNSFVGMLLDYQLWETGNQYNLYRLYSSCGEDIVKNNSN